MSDLSDTARTAARTEAEEHIGGVIAKTWFVEGSRFIAGRLPGRDELARWYCDYEEICSSAFDENEPCFKHQRLCYNYADEVLELIERSINEH